MKSCPTIRFVPHLPDLMNYGDYEAEENAQGMRTIKFRITVTSEGVTILGDSQHPIALDELLARLGAAEVEQMLCG